MTLVEMLVVLTLCLILTTAAVPWGLRHFARQRVRAAGRDAAALLKHCRVQAALQNVHAAIWFVEGEGGWRYSAYYDGNNNGVRLKDIGSGLDPCIRSPETFASRFHRVPLALIERSSIRSVPPSTGRIQGRHPVRFGQTGLVSFNPLGMSSSGTLYLSDGKYAMVAVRLFGPTGRMRLWEYDRTANRWKRYDAF